MFWCRRRVGCRLIAKPSANEGGSYCYFRLRKDRRDLSSKVCYFKDAHTEKGRVKVNLEGIIVKKSTCLSIVFIIASIAFFSWSGLLIAAESGVFITKSRDAYNLSFTLPNANYTRELQNIIINPRSDEPKTGLTEYINGTVVNGTNPISKAIIKAGDNLQVNLMRPYTAFKSGTTIEVQVLGAVL